MALPGPATPANVPERAEHGILTPAVAPPLYARLRRKEESRSLGGRLGFDCRSL